MATLLNPFLRAEDANGASVSGGKFELFMAGTTDPVTTYSDRLLTTPQPQPLVANAAGEFAQSFVFEGVYKMRISGADDVILYENDFVQVSEKPSETPYASRAALIAAIDVLSGGVIVSIGQTPERHLVSFIKDGGSDIADLPGMSAFGTPRAEHYAENTTPGTTDMAAAINSCLAVHGECHLLSGQYGVGATIARDNCTLKGVHGHGTGRTRLVGLSAVLPIANAVVKVGRSSIIDGFTIEYDALTGSETRDQRVGLDTRGATFILQRGSIVNNIRFDNVGTAISDYDGGAFSIHFGVIEVVRHSYAGVDIRLQGGTGNSWDNIYINGENAYTPVYGFNSEQGMFGSAQIINVEHGTYSGAAVRFKRTCSGTVLTLHVEGVDVSAANSCYIDFDEATMSFGTIGVINTRASFDNLSMIRLNGTQFRLTDTDGQESTSNTVTVGALQTVGLAVPNVPKYPTYPTGRRGLDKVLGFQFIGRPVGFTDRQYRIEVGSHEFGAYASHPAAFPIYRYAATRHSDANGNIDIVRFGKFGSRVATPRNFVPNGAFDTFAATSATTGATAVEVATDWFIFASTSSITATREFDENGRDNTHFTRVTNVGTIGTFQRYYTTFTDVRPLLDTDLCLQFEMRGPVAVRVLEQISMTLTTGGSPATVFKQVASGANSNLDATLDWKFYEFDFTVSSTGVTLGASPFFTLQFQINDAVASRGRAFDLRNVKLAQGKGGSAFVRKLV